MHQLLDIFIVFQDIEMEIDRGFFKRLEIPGPPAGELLHVSSSKWAELSYCQIRLDH